MITRAQWTEIQRAFRLQAERSGSSQRVGAQRLWHTGRFLCGGCGKRDHRHFGQIRCDNSACSQQYGNGSVNADLARHSLIRALEFIGVGIVEQLAPMKAAAESTEAAPPPAVLQLQSEIAALEAITGTAPLIQQKQTEIDRLMADVTGHQVTTLQAMEALDVPLRCPWELDDDQLLQVLDDLELTANVSNKWVVRVESRRFGGVWSFDPATGKETFSNSGNTAEAEFTSLEKDFRPMAPLGDATPQFTRTTFWHAVVDDERERLASTPKPTNKTNGKKEKDT